MTSTPPPYDPAQDPTQAGRFGPSPQGAPVGDPYAPPADGSAGSAAGVYGPPPGAQPYPPAAPGSYGPPPSAQPYPPAAPGSYGPPPGSAAPYPGAPYAGAPAPGPSPYATATAPAQPVAPFWVALFGVLAVLGIIAVILPWFHPTLDGHRIAGIKDFHSWNGILFFIAPILMIVSAVRAVTGRTNLAQFRQAGITGMISGALLLVSAIVGYARVPGAYTNWDEVKAEAASRGITLGRGPELGWFLTIAVGVLFIALGIAAVLQAKRRRG